MSKEQVSEYIKVELAGVKFEIECFYQRTYSFFRDYLASFDKPDYTLSVTKSEIDRNRRIVSYISDDDTLSIVTDSDSHNEISILFKKITNALMEHSTLLMHGTVVGMGDNAFMITAPSGTGKSTRARIWLEEYPESIILNGDKPFITVTDTSVIACGTPWCGKEGWNTNAMIPLRAILLLERADEDENNMIERISAQEAFPFLMRQTYCEHDSVDIKRVVQLLKKIECKVKLYRFHSVPTPEAIHLAYETVISDIDVDGVS